MSYVTIEGASSQLSQLIDRACKGEEIISVTAEDLKHFSLSERIA